jgi:hypothetical protein
MARKTNFREEVPSFLIVCEGKRTEPSYFRGFHVGRVLDVRVEGLGQSTVNLVRETIRLRNQDDYDQVWVVFDIDNCTPAQVNEAIRLAEKNGIQVAYSNQAFELWYLLHFDYHHSSVDRKQYIYKLTKTLGGTYTKNAPDLYIRLLNRQPTAIQNAKRLLATYDPPDPCRDDPSTTVFQLVEELIRHTRDSRR